jgi:hypothetical protein
MVIRIYDLRFLDGKTCEFKSWVLVVAISNRTQLYIWLDPNCRGKCSGTFYIKDARSIQPPASECRVYTTMISTKPTLCLSPRNTLQGVMIVFGSTGPQKTKCHVCQDCICTSRKLGAIAYIAGCVLDSRAFPELCSSRHQLLV